MHKNFRADQVSNIAKNATIRPQTMLRAQNKSDLRFYCIFRDCIKRAFWKYTGCHTNFESLQRCAHKPVKMRCFSIQTWLSREYNSPPSSVGPDFWRTFQLSTWAFWAYVVLQGQFLSKTRCGRGGAPKRKFSAQTWQSRAYTPPPSSVGLKTWCITKLSTWAFRV